MRYLLSLLLLAAPLSAQQDSVIVVGTIPIPTPTVIVQGDTVLVDMDVQVYTDSLAVAIQRAQESIAEAIRDCNCAGPQQVDRSLRAVMLIVLGYAAWQLKKIADKPNGDDIHNEGNVKVENVVNVPEHKHPPHDHDKDGEG